LRLVILRRYVTPGDAHDAAINYIVGHGKVWTRLDAAPPWTAYLDRL
jgi:hypothetical protein